MELFNLCRIRFWGEKADNNEKQHIDKQSPGATGECEPKRCFPDKLRCQHGYKSGNQSGKRSLAGCAFPIQRTDERRHYLQAAAQREG